MKFIEFTKNREDRRRASTMPTMSLPLKKINALKIKYFIVTFFFHLSDFYFSVVIKLKTVLTISAHHYKKKESEN